jgi:hypothetical protein
MSYDAARHFVTMLDCRNGATVATVSPRMDQFATFVASLMSSSECLLRGDLH